MRAFACPGCSALVFFENSVCVTCGAAIGFHRPSARFARLEPTADGPRHRDDTDREWAPCGNLALATCNWLAEVDGGGLCACCRLTRTRPADDDALALAAFARTEAAKRRLVFQLDFLRLPIDGGLAFDLLSSKQTKVVTGHEHGVITIDLAEGEDPHREAVRLSLGEAYRTVLGHLRHEVGHWYWELLVERDAAKLARFRELFGDERRDYGQALAQHYAASPSDDWRTSFISSYAAAHPWEDFAECFAHYLHMTDTLQTAAAYGVSVTGPDLALATARLAATPRERYESFDQLLGAWLPVSYAFNAVNRSMGMSDVYPFVIVPPAIEKLRFVADLIAP